MKTLVQLIFAAFIAVAAILTAAAAPGNLDLGFNPNVTGVSVYLNAIAVQPDGKIIIGGVFTNVGGQARNNIARLNADGSVDLSFNPGSGTSGTTGTAPDGVVYSVAVQADGKILLGGGFTTVNGQTRNRIARLNADGSVESTATFNPGTGANNHVYSVGLQADGKILLGGGFGSINSQSRQFVARLNTDGTLESSSTFNPGVGPNDAVYCVAVQPDGRILLGGNFTSINGQSRNNIARLNADGTLESTTTFNPGTGANANVFGVVVQPDGKILLGGQFTSVNGQSRNRIARLNFDGSVESTSTFNAGTGAGDTVLGMALQADGKILLGGFFTNFNGQSRNRIARLNSDGTVEGTSTFNSGAGANAVVYAVAAQADGKILIGGQFTSVSGTSRNNIASLANDAVSRIITIPTSERVQWFRGGAAPEVEQVTFELSTDGGANWIPLGPGTRIVGGWERSSLSLPVSGTIRARGRTVGGVYSSSGMVEMVVAFPDGPEIVVEQPAGTHLADGGTKNFGTVAIGANSSHTFTIKNIGTENLTGLGITVDGPDAAMFTITASPIAPISGPFGSTTFTVQFAPTSAGNKIAALHITSNDGDENPFDVTLTGRNTTIDADLSNLVLSAGTLTPAFSTPITSYATSVSSETTSVTVTPTAAQTIATIKVNGVTVASGAASTALNLNVGNNVITTVVTAGDGVTTMTYTITITRPAGGVDPAFDPNVSGTNLVYCMALQPDGKILIGGSFTTVGGLTRNRIARLNADGTVESTATFNPGTGPSGDVYSVAVQADGKILLVGAFTTVNSQTRNYIARLNADGTVESTATFNPGTGASNSVNSVAVQADGKILIGGTFTSVGGQSRSRIARLNADGMVESTATFNPGTGASSSVLSVAVQADGKILLGGWFLTVNGQTRNRIARLNADGTLEDTATFNPGTGANSQVYSVAVQADGKILLGGLFTSVNGQTRNYIARLNTDGMLEDTATFNPGTGAANAVNSIAVQADGKILIGGAFITVAGLTRNRIARLNADGTLEDTATFNPGTGANSEVYCVAVQADGKILIGGSFTTVNGQARNRIARLVNQAATQAITVPNSARVQWARGGSAPEVEPVSFELSTDEGASWNPLGAAARITGGWELTGLSLPGSGLIRARGRTAGGYLNGSSGLIEVITAFPAGPEIVVEQPAGTFLADGGSRSFGPVNLGANANFIFKINSIGTEDLTGLGITVDGPDAAMFTVTTSPTAPLSAPFGTTTFTVRFAPTTVGTKTATIHIASNDADESSFDITLTGVGKSLDPTFNPNVTGTQVLATAVQPDGKMVLGGDFTSVAGQIRNYVARLLGDGSVESTATFDPGSSANSPVSCAAVQSDGKIVIAGAFTTVNGESRNRLARLNADGTLENIATFDPGTGVDGAINGLALQPDGKILLVGDFSNVNGQPRTRIARLNVDGSVEGLGTFNPGTGASAVVNSVVVQPDGHILIGGDFLSLNGQARTRIARLNADGALEDIATFNPGTGADTAINTLAVQADGRILMGGAFTMVNGQPRNGIARLNTDGTVEPVGTFDSGTGANGSVTSIAIQADGKILIGGAFTTVNGQSRGGIARLFANGTLEDTTNFNPGTGANAAVNGVALQADGKILMGGLFTSVNGTVRNKIARFGNEVALQTLAIPNSLRVQWDRGGTAPEVGSVTFELSTDETNWTSLGSGTRIAGGWELTGLTLPSVGSIRARGRTTGGYFNASSGLVQQIQSFANVPVISTEVPTNVMATTATLNGTVNPNGSATIYFEYGPTASYGSATPGQSIVGAVVVNVQAPLIGIVGNAPYHYRLVATNGAGTVYGADVSFVTAPDPPLTITGSPTGITSTSATLVGSINPKGRVTSAYFEYGATTLYGSTTPLQTIPAGTSVVNVLESLSGLPPNATYHYRLVASSTGGSANGEDVSFTTNFPLPQATTGSASPLTTTSVRVTGMVRGFNASTEVFFDYGTDNVNFPNSVAANPLVVTGDTETAVSGDLINLAQGVTYHYRVRAVSAGGTTNGTSAPFSLAILSGLTQVFPGTAPAAEGFVVVNLSPTVSGSGWRFLGEQQWRASGAAAGGLTTGDRIIEFRPVPGWIQPPPETVGVISENGTTIVSKTYYNSGVTGSGGISVTLKPNSIAQEVLVTNRSQWRLLGEDDSQWKDSGATVSGLPPGSYLVECKAVPGRITPPLSNVTVTDAQTAAPTLTYFVPDSVTGTLPSVLSFETVSTSENLPYAYVGQIRSNVGTSTGFAVKERVVATAAHVVWDDGTLSAVQGLQWLFQRHRGTYEPVPKAPRGFYVMAGYAAQRQSENSPGSFSPQSRNLDVAALYFLSAAARGGHGGFLASDLDANEFLLSNANKMLVGYPVDGVATGSQGRMHATTPGNVVFSAVGAAANRTYLTTGIRSTGGASGGPLCVQYDGGTYYPAAVYLGGTEQTLVRAIDSAVIDLFNRAELSGIDDLPHTGGGITHTSFASIGNSSSPGSIKVTIQPAAARNAGAGWRLKPVTDWQPSGNQVGDLNAGSYILQLLTVGGFQAPTEQTVAITNGQLNEITFTYEVANDAPTISHLANQTIDEDESTDGLDFTIDDTETPANSLTVTGSSSNTTLVPNSNIVFSGSGANRTVTVIPAPNQNGSATITLTVSDGSRDDTETFTLEVNPVNDEPTISNVTNKSTTEDHPTAAINFVIGDVDNAENSLEITGFSSNTTLVPNDNIVFGGSGANRTSTVTPAANQSGSATIYLTVSDGDFTDTDTFVLTVTAVNDAPTINNIASQAINEDSDTGPLSVTIGDIETPASSLTLNGSSSNTTLVPNSNILFGGSGANRTVTVTPAPDQLGTATISVTVSDGTLTDTDTFTLTVTGTALQTWRFEHFGSASDTGDAANSADPDGDGSSNLDEYTAGTGPNSAADFFKILTSVKTASTFTVTVSGKAARTYVLERQTTLSTGTWTTVTTAGPLAADGPVNLTDPAPPANAGFYRMRVSAP